MTASRVIDHGRSIATGTLAELVGRAANVRVKITGLGEGWWLDFAGYGNWARDGDWLTVEKVGPRRVPGAGRGHCRYRGPGRSRDPRAHDP